MAPLQSQRSIWLLQSSLRSMLSQGIRVLAMQNFRPYSRRQSHRSSSSHLIWFLKPPHVITSSSSTSSRRLSIDPPWYVPRLHWHSHDCVISPQPQPKSIPPWGHTAPTAWLVFPPMQVTDSKPAP